MQAQELVLRDVHVPAAPSMWPPAPGWWLLAVAVLTVIAVIWFLKLRQQRKLEARRRLFDEACRDLPASVQIAAMSELLRRAARKVDKHADRLQGEAWLQFLSVLGFTPDRKEDMLQDLDHCLDAGETILIDYRQTYGL